VQWSVTIFVGQVEAAVFPHQQLLFFLISIEAEKDERMI
jgi:hypothetical protein